MDAPALQRMMDDACRADFRTFFSYAQRALSGTGITPNWHIDAMAFVLQKTAGPAPMRQIISMPPRYLKTQACNICLSAWLLGRNPRTKIVCISYSGSLAQKFNSDTLRLMKTPFYRRLFPKTVLVREAKEELTTTAGGSRTATSVEGTLTGLGADLIIADDLLNAGDAHSPTARENTFNWFSETVLTRFDKPQESKLLVVAQRLHLEDPVGRLLQAGGWNELTIAAIAQKDTSYDILPGGKPHFVPAGTILMPSRHDLPALEQLKKEMGEQNFEAQFNQRPLPPGGATFKAQWIKRYGAPPPASARIGIIQSWDTAHEKNEHNDYSVCTTWAFCGDGFYLLDVWRGRVEYWELKKKLFELKAKHCANLVIVEKAGSGIPLVQELRAMGHMWLQYFDPKPGKVTRAEQQAAKFEAGRVHLPQQADWLVAYETELLTFPHCKHDDQVDSTTQFLWATGTEGQHLRTLLKQFGGL